MKDKPIKIKSWDEYEHKKSDKSNKGKQDLKDIPDYVKKEKSVKSLIKDGFFTSIKNGITSNYLMPFAIAMSASNGMLALISSVPTLVANFFQLFSQESLKIFKTRRNLIVWTAAVQALVWLPMLLIPFFARSAIWLILLFATIEATVGAFQGPIYNSILGDVIDESKRGEFFGKRNMIVNFINFLSTLIAGFVLNYFKNLDTNIPHYIFIGFAILFSIALITRLIASYFKGQIYEPEFRPKKVSITFFKFLKSMTKDNYGIFVSYVFFFQLAASISAPFFALYLLRDMHVNYIGYTLISSISIVAAFLSMSLWGRLIDRYGSKFVLTVAGFLVPLSPLMLVLAIYIKDPTAVLVFILAEETFSGFAWAGFNLSTSSFLFDATEKDVRIKYNAYYNFIVGVGVFLGATLGGLLIGIFPVWVVSAIPFVLLTSGLLRLLSTSLMIKKVREARMVEVDFAGRGFFHSVIAITPHFGATVEIISPYEGREHYKFHKIIPVGRKKTVDPVQDKERELYYKKSLELYKQSAMQTMSGSRKDIKDDSDRLQEVIEKDKKEIAKITENIKKDVAKK